MNQRYDIALVGCNPTPLASYLRALAILRLVSEQVDAGAEGWWEHEVFHLRSVLNEEALVRFFCEEYVPTPILAPWNGGSGFYPKDARDALEAIRDSASERLAVYRASIAVADRMIIQESLSERPEKQQKTDLVALCRSWLPDAAVEWLDAAVVLTSDSPAYPPLLGTGGNDGRLEFTNNFMQRLLDVIDPISGQSTSFSSSWLESVLFDVTTSGLPKASIGQFSPGAAGGPNARAGFDGNALVNPWEFVLMIEGALVFAAAATKRLETGRTAVLSYPFTVRASGVGSGAIREGDEESSRPEMWMPLWDRPACYREVAHVFQEGRADVNGRPARTRQARNGIDFARACAALAVDRGITSFQRFGFVQRSGNMYLAVPLNRFVVSRRAEADLLTDLDKSNWLGAVTAFCRKSEIGSYGSALRQIHEAMFQLSARGGRNRVQALLVALGRIERLLAHYPQGRESVRPLVLEDAHWLDAAAESAEFELALAVASWFTKGMPVVRAYFSPVEEQNGRTWSPVVEPRVVWQDGDLSRNLVHLLRRRLIDADMKRRSEPTESKERLDMPDGTSESAVVKTAEWDKPLGGWYKVRLRSVLQFLRGELNEDRISDLIWGLLPFAGSGILKNWAIQRGCRQLEGADEGEIPWAYAVTRLVTTPDKDLRRALKAQRLPEEFHVPVPRELFGTLATDRPAALDKMAELAARRLLASGLTVSRAASRVRTQGISARRCAAAMAFPLCDADVRKLTKMIG